MPLDTAGELLSRQHRHLVTFFPYPSSD